MKTLVIPLFLAIISLPKFSDEVCTFHLDDSCSNYGTIAIPQNFNSLKPNSPDIDGAPQELLFFEVRAGKEFNSLRWVVASQDEIIGFNVHESDDNVKYESLTTVDVNHDGGFITEYTVIDRQLNSEFTFYKVEFKRKDGKSAFSDVISVENLVQHVTVFKSI